MPTETRRARAARAAREMTGGAIGAGLVLVVLPSLALFFGIDRISKTPGIGLPILAIFGIMILFGALALVSTLFERLGLSDKREALALPNGSVRATIALALIVLFAIIAIMLYQSTSQPYVIAGVSKAQLTAMLLETANRVIAVVPECAGSECPTYAVHVALSPAQESTDLAKQLLILIGTLMTSVTSFYFASRTVEGVKDTAGSGDEGEQAAHLLEDDGGLPSAAPDAEDTTDGCDVSITDPTPDDELPPARGGVS